MIEVEALLAGVPGDSRCGPDLEYDPDFIALDQAARGKPEHQLGDTLVPAEEPDWADVQRRAQNLLARSKDLRVAILLCRALARLSDGEGLWTGLTLVKELLSRYWDGVHPRLDPDDGDPLMRLNAVAALADPEAFVRDVRSIYLVRPGRHGRVTVRDVLIAAGKLEPTGNESPQSTGQLSGVIRASQTEGVGAMQAMRQALQVLGDLQSLLADKIVAINADRKAKNDKVEVAQTPSLQPLVEVLEATVAFCKEVAGVEAAAPGNQPGTDQMGAPNQGAGEVRNREDAVRLLNCVCEFIERTEPSNPAPLLLRRAGRLMNKNFVQIIEDLAPDSVGQIQKIVGMDGK